MASKRQSRKPRTAAAPKAEPLTFLPDEPRSFAYVDEEDEFEVPQIPSALARSGARMSVAFSLRMQPSYGDLPV